MLITIDKGVKVSNFTNFGEFAVNDDKALVFIIEKADDGRELYILFLVFDTKDLGNERKIVWIAERKSECEEVLAFLTGQDVLTSFRERRKQQKENEKNEQRTDT